MSISGFFRFAVINFKYGLLEAISDIALDISDGARLRGDKQTQDFWNRVSQKTGAPDREFEKSRESLTHAYAERVIWFCYRDPYPERIYQVLESEVHSNVYGVTKESVLEYLKSNIDSDVFLKHNMTDEERETMLSGMKARLDAGVDLNAASKTGADQEFPDRSI